MWDSAIGGRTSPQDTGPAPWAIGHGCAFWGWAQARAQWPMMQVLCRTALYHVLWHCPTSYPPFLYPLMLSYVPCVPWLRRGHTPLCWAHCGANEAWPNGLAAWSPSDFRKPNGIKATMHVETTNRRGSLERVARRCSQCACGCHQPDMILKRAVRCCSQWTRGFRPSTGSGNIAGNLVHHQ